MAAVAFATAPQADPAAGRRELLSPVAKPLTSQSNKVRLMPFCKIKANGVRCLALVEQKKLLAFLVLQAAIESTHQ